MNKSMLIGAVAGIGFATAGAVMAAYAMRDQNPADEFVAEATIESMSAEEGAGAVTDVALESGSDAALMPADPAPAMAAVSAQPAPSAAPPAAKTKPKAKTRAKAPAPEPAATVAQAPKEECWDEVVTHTADPKDDHRIAGTVIGGVVGAAVGHQFGGGSGKTLATVAGAAGGAYAGNRAQKAVQENNTYETTERRCKTVQ